MNHHSLQVSHLFRTPRRDDDGFTLVDCREQSTVAFHKIVHTHSYLLSYPEFISNCFFFYLIHVTRGLNLSRTIRVFVSSKNGTPLS